MISLFIAVLLRTLTQLFPWPNIRPVSNVYVLQDDTASLSEELSAIAVDLPSSSKALRTIARESSAEYVFLFLQPKGFLPNYRCIERMLQVAKDTNASMVYADCWDQHEEENGSFSTPTLHPVNDYQLGSVRDDYDFGGLWLVRGNLLREFALGHKQRYKYAAPYALRLYLSRNGELVHLREPLYSLLETDLRKSGEKQFDYVSPSAREVQLEMEKACTQHLKEIGAWISLDEYDDVPTPFPKTFMSGNGAIQRKRTSLSRNSSTSHSSARRKLRTISCYSIGHYSRAQPRTHHSRCREFCFVTNC